MIVGFTFKNNIHDVMDIDHIPEDPKTEVFVDLDFFLIYSC